MNQFHTFCISTFKLHPLAKILPHWSQLNLFIFMKICNFNPVILVVYEGWGKIFATKNTNEFKVFFITNFLMKNLKLKTFRINCLIAMFVNRNLTNMPLKFILPSNILIFEMVIPTILWYMWQCFWKQHQVSQHIKNVHDIHMQFLHKLFWQKQAITNGH